MRRKVVTITEEHFKLLDASYIEHNEWVEFGGFAQDPKRPYGNSSVYEDIAEILDLTPEGGDEYEPEFTGEQRDYMSKLHKELADVLTICLKFRSFELGTFECVGYGNDWKRIEGAGV